MEPEDPQSLLDQYYGPLLASQHLSVKYISKTLGKGLFSTKNVNKGEVIFFEVPLASQQWTRSKPSAYCCTECLSFLGPNLLAHLRTLIPCKLKELPRQNLAPKLPKPCIDPATKLPYCSDKCMKASKVNHILYQSAASAQFRQQSELVCDRFFMAGRIILTIIFDVVIEGKSIENAYRPYANFARGPWVKLLSNQKLGKPDYNDSKQALQMQLEASHTLLREIILEFLVVSNYSLDKNSELEQFLTIDFYESLLGVFELNNATLEVPSPMHKYFETLASDKKLFNSTQPILAPIVTALNTTYNCIPSCAGNGLFTIHSCMNHSCDPNAKQVLHDSITSARICIEAIKDIKQGDQIFISYIRNETPNTDERKKELFLNYGFVCQCERCSKK